MIYRRENPKTPSLRFKSVILNPVGEKIRKIFFYKIHQKPVSKHFGTKVCLRRKKSVYCTKFNVWYGVYQKLHSVLINISLSRRYKTFVGLLKYSNGAICCLPVFSGANLGQFIKVFTYSKNPKFQYFTQLSTGSVVPVAYLSVTTCFFNIMYFFGKFSWFCRAGGTYCIIIRINFEKGYSVIKLPTKKLYILNEITYVMLGRNSNVLPKGIWKGKAGINVLSGFRPAVRGVAKNPVDHPHGGRTKSNQPERTPWGRIAKFNK